jgi:hypothetical protein
MAQDKPLTWWVEDENGTNKSTPYDTEEQAADRAREMLWQQGSWTPKWIVCSDGRRHRAPSLTPVTDLNAATPITTEKTTTTRPQTGPTTAEDE